MIGRLEQQTKYGIDVKVNSLMEQLRPSECLCLNCASLRPGQADNCQIAERLYHICVGEHVALAVTRCPVFIPRSGTGVAK